MILVSGYKYTESETGRRMVELYMDDHDCLQDIANKKHPLGGVVSVRSYTHHRPTIIFGQDEAVFNENSTNTMQWVGPNGERPLLPKNNGLGVMISAFQSCEFGWG